MSRGSVSIIKRVELLQNRRPRPQVNITQETVSMTTKRNLVGIMLLEEETGKRKKRCSVFINYYGVGHVNI